MTVQAPEMDRKIAEVAASCGCGNLRRASRAVTQFYDAKLQPSGLKATQFNLLVAAARVGRVPIGRLAALLVMDRTTLTRNLRPLAAQGLLRIEPGSDRRSREIEITAQGRRRLARALPLWDQAQTHLVTALGESRWSSLLGVLSSVVASTRPD